MIKALIGCTTEEAHRIVGTAGTVAASGGELAQTLAALRGGSATGASGPAFLELPTEFRRLSNAGLGKLFWNYLRSRGYNDGRIEWLIKTYGLRYATKGKFAYRIIIPINDRDNELVTWIARTIIKGEEPRYRTPWSESVKELITDCLFGLPLLWSVNNPNVLVVCEGPFDAMRVTAYGYPHGVYGTCLFGLKVSIAQIYLLQELQRRFNNTILLLDYDANLKRLPMLKLLSAIRCSTYTLPPNLKDPGELTAKEATQLAMQLCSIF